MKLLSLGGIVFFVLYGTIIDQVLNQLDIPYSSYITQGVSKVDQAPCRARHPTGNDRCDYIGRVRRGASNT